MDQLKAFARNFVNEELEELKKARMLGRQYFFEDDEVRGIREKIKLEPYSQGLFLGEFKDKRFIPGFPLLDILAKHSDRKVFVNKKGETLFLYKRNILEESITKLNAKEGLVLVQNENDENLGFGEIRMEKNTLVVKNLLDRGDFLRRER